MASSVESLEDPNRVIRTEHNHGRVETNPSGLCCNRREHDLGRGHSEIGGVVFPNAEENDLKRIGKQSLLGEIANDLRVRQGMAVVTKGNVTECIARVQAPLSSRYSGRQAAALQANSRRLFSFSETDYSAISGKTLSFESRRSADSLARRPNRCAKAPVYTPILQKIDLHCSRTTPSVAFRTGRAAVAWASATS
jgi:hypothetical protein